MTKPSAFGFLISVAMAIGIPIALAQEKEQGKQTKAPASRPATSSRSSKAIAVATEWAKALFQADLKGVLETSALPFAFDSKKLLVSSDELSSALKGVKTFTGETKPGSVRLGKASVLEDVLRMSPPCVPDDYLIVGIRLGVEAELLKVCVRPGTHYKVIGFKD